MGTTGKRVNVGFHGQITNFPDLGEGGIDNSFLSDGDHIKVDCSDCGAPLADVWITQPDVKVRSEIIAQCPHCNDKSFVKKAQGKFHLGITDYTNHVNVHHDFLDDDGSGFIRQKVNIETSRGKEWPKDR